MFEIIPAILESDAAAVTARLDQIKHFDGVTTVQIDFCDGIFVANKTVAVEDLPALPKKIVFEAHVMAESPNNFTAYAAAGFARVIVHYEAFATELALEEALKAIRAAGLEPAIAINPETPVTVLRYFGDTIERFTILGVHPGQQGQAFLPETIMRLTDARAVLPHAILEVDGGVTAAHLPELQAAGASCCVVGSAIFGKSDPAAAYTALRTEIKT
jgi:ribulose-phosphate 3-epimerase